MAKIILKGGDAWNAADLDDGGVFGALGRWIAARRDRATMRTIINELLSYDDRLLEDAGLLRTVLEDALQRPEAYDGMEQVRRRSAAELREREAPPRRK